MSQTTPDGGWVRILALAVDAAFDAKHADCDVDDDAVAEAVDQMIYVGALMVESNDMREKPGVDRDDAPYPADLQERHRRQIGDLSGDVGAQTLRLSFARVVVAVGKQLLKEAVSQLHGTGTVTSSTIEAMDAALDAYEGMDRGLPKVEG